MQPHTKISVVVPVYNAEQFLRECIQSVSDQTFGNWELILVDDGSKDRSGEICDEFARTDSRIKVIHQANGGPTSARNAGVNAAGGEYVVFLDSDDYFADGLLAELVNIMDDHHPDVIIFQGMGFSGEGQIPVECLLEPGLYEGERLDIVHRSIILNEKDEIAITYGVCMKAFCRELYLPYQASVPKELYKGEDLAVCAPLIADAERVYVSDFYGYYYRDNPNSIMHTFRPDEVAQIQMTAEYLMDKMGSFYQSRIDAYVLTHYFDYLDRAMLSVGGYGAYKKLVRETLSDQLKASLKLARSHSPNANEKLVFFLLRHRLFGLLWLLRHIKPRQG